jgi:prohibitin 2
MYEDENKHGVFSIIGLIVVVLFAIIGLGALISSITSIEPGFVGIVFDKQTKEISPIPLHPGWSFVKPFSVQVIELETRIQKEQVKANAASKDLQAASTEVALNYRIASDNAPWIFENIGLDYKSRIIDPAIQESVKAATATFTAEELIIRRESVRNAIESSLRERLAKYRVEVDTLSITNFDFSPDFQKAIEDKQTAAQLALKAENDLVRIKVEAEQTIATAKAQAQAIQIKGDALQKNPSLVQLELAQRWNGVMPSFYVAGQSGFTGGMLLNVPQIPIGK